MSHETIHNIRISILSECLEASKIEYSNLIKDFTELDAKAQSTTAIAGIFLAGSLAFYNGESLSKLIGFGGLFGVLLLAAAVSMLVISVAFNIRTMTIRDVATVDSASANDAVEDLLAGTVQDHEWPDVHERYIRDRITVWQYASRNLSAKNNEKAKTLSRGQLCLSLAVALVGLLLLTVLIGTWILRFRK